MKQILVTGGSGYIGSHVAKMLYEHGYLPVVFDLAAENKTWTNPNWPSYCGDVNNTRQLEKVFEIYNFDAVVHLAAYNEIGTSIWNPLKYYRNNIEGTASVVEACIKYHIKKIIFSSSSSIYGIINPKDLPTKETHTKNPIAAYGVSKLASEYMLRDIELAHGIRSVSLRYFNATGAAPDSSIGEWRFEPKHLIPSIQSYLEGRSQYFTLFGKDYNTRDGSAVRDYTHVWDVAQAHINSLEYLDNGGTTVAVNIGAGNKQGISVLEIVKEFEKQLGLKIDIKYAERRPGDIPANYADINLAKTLLGWEPSISTPYNIVKDALNWYDSELYRSILNDHINDSIIDTATDKTLVH